MEDQVTIQKAENGFILCYCEKEKPMGAGVYANSMTEHKKEVFSSKDTKAMFDKVISILSEKEEEGEDD